MDKLEDLRIAIIDDIMDKIYEDGNLGIIRDALYSYYELATIAELETEYKERALSNEC